MKRVIVRVLFLHELSCSEVGLHDVEAGRNVAQTERCAFCGSLRCGYGLACDIAYENSLAGVRRPIGLRSPSNQIAFAVQSDCVRRPIRLRPPSNRVASAVQSDCVRRPIRLRPPSDRIIIECTHSAPSRIVIRIVACCGGRRPPLRLWHV